jgi:hypothetical protein
VDFEISRPNNREKALAYAVQTFDASVGNPRRPFAMSTRHLIARAEAFRQFLDGETDDEEETEEDEPGQPWPEREN